MSARHPAVAESPLERLRRLTGDQAARVVVVYGHPRRVVLGYIVEVDGRSLTSARTEGEAIAEALQLAESAAGAPTQGYLHQQPAAQRKP